MSNVSPELNITNSAPIPPGSGGDDALNCGSGGGDGAHLSLRVLSIFVILIGSMFGALFPVLARRTKWLGARVPKSVFDTAKYFGSGVIIATAFIHLLDPAIEELGSPCLGAGWGDYPYALAIALVSIFMIFLVEIVAFRWGTAKLAALGITHDPHGHGISEEHSHNHQHNHGHATPDEENALALTRTHTNHSHSHSHTHHSHAPHHGMLAPVAVGAHAAHGPESGFTGGSNLEANVSRGCTDEASTAGSEPLTLVSGDKEKARLKENEKEHADSTAQVVMAHAHAHGHEPGEGGGVHGPMSDSAATQIVGVAILEFGVVLHSFLIGLTLAVTQEFKILFIVLVFHQTFEGLGVGSRLAYMDLPHKYNYIPVLGAILFGITTPIGIAIGLGVRTSYNPGSTTASIVSGVLDAFSAGILIYTGLVELLAHEFLFNKEMINASNSKLAYAIGCMMAGCALMALLGRWA